MVFEEGSMKTLVQGILNGEIVNEFSSLKFLVRCFRERGNLKDAAGIRAGMKQI